MGRRRPDDDDDEDETDTNNTVGREMTAKEDMKYATIYLRKRGVSYRGGSRVSTINVNNRMIRKPRLQHFPATRHSTGD